MVWTTHTVFNQPNPLGNGNLFLSDMPPRGQNRLFDLTQQLFDLCDTLLQRAMGV
ncbi:hypothetical protein [Serratia silvae]|uniref:Uncharacterized protein n=1 Tax=Serratia silvae TaxID=2824122 RepID=A0ABT0KFW5_9GAMM|nr:hypothetical protein [Serratia silvae]MCL1030826.1 hypothetical protein [Serratia silvae]